MLPPFLVFRPGFVSGWGHIIAVMMTPTKAASTAQAGAANQKAHNGHPNMLVACRVVAAATAAAVAAAAVAAVAAAAVAAVAAAGAPPAGRAVGSVFRCRRGDLVVRERAGLRRAVFVAAPYNTYGIVVRGVCMNVSIYVYGAYALYGARTASSRSRRCSGRWSRGAWCS